MKKLNMCLNTERWEIKSYDGKGEMVEQELERVCVCVWTEHFVFLWCDMICLSHITLQMLGLKLGHRFLCSALSKRCTSLTVLRLASIENPSTKVLTVSCQPLQTNAAPLFRFRPQISGHIVGGHFLYRLTIRSQARASFACPAKFTQRQNTHRVVDGEIGFCPAVAETLDLSAAQGLVVQLLKELLRSVSCFLEASSIFTAALFSSALKCL